MAMNDPQPEGPKESDIAEKAAQKRRPAFNPLGRIEQLTSDETKIADIRRHPFGLFLIFLQTIVGFGLALIIIFALMPGVLETLGLTGSGADSLLYLFGFFAIVFAVLFLLLAAKVYNGNQLIVSDSNITQVLQIGIFNRKISELGMGNIEDVTAQQSGIFPTLLNYGTLKVETAGEQNNFVFVYCPNPNAYAKAMLDARQKFVATHAGHH